MSMVQRNLSIRWRTPTTISGIGVMAVPAANQKVSAFSRIELAFAKCDCETCSRVSDSQMKHDPELKRLLLLDLRDGGLEEKIAAYPPELVLEQKARLIDEGLADGRAIRDGLKLRWVKALRINSAGHRWLEAQETAPPVAAVSMGAAAKTPRTKLIFVSHCHADADLVEAIVELLCAALGMQRKDFRCTSVEGSALPGGAQTGEHLRREIAEAPAFISVLTPQSLGSFYVLFELGARWGNAKSHIPLLARGTSSAVLKDPLKATMALDLTSDAKVHQLVHDLAEVLGRTVEPANSYVAKVRAVLRLAKPPRRRAASADADSQAGAAARDPDRMDDACEKVLGKLANEPLLGIFPLEFAKDIGLHRVRVDVCLRTCEERGLIAIGKGDNKQRSCSVTEAGQQYLLRHGLV